MEYINLHTSDLDSDAFLGSEPVERATWLCLMRYCAGQENGGRIKDCRHWTDRKWQQIVRVTEQEASAASALWSWENNDLIVKFYPIKSEEKLKSCRENGAKGGRPSKPRRNPGETQGKPSDNHKGKKGKEKECKEKEWNGNVTPEALRNAAVTAPLRDVTPPRPIGLTEMEQRILRLLSFFNISASIATIGKSAMEAFLAQPTFLDDEAMDVIQAKSGPWLAQDWIRDVNPRFIAERIAEIYHYQPNEKRGASRGSTVADRDFEKTGLRQEIELPKL